MNHYNYKPWQGDGVGWVPAKPPSTGLVRPEKRLNQIMTVEELDALPEGTLLDKVYTGLGGPEDCIKLLRWYGRTDGDKTSQSVRLYPGGAWFLYESVRNRYALHHEQASLVDCCVIPDSGGMWNQWNYLRLPIDPEQPIFG